MLQILCTRGYSDQLIGLSNSALLLSSIISAFPIGYWAFSTGKLIFVAKVGPSFNDILKVHYDWQYYPHQNLTEL